MLDAFARQMLYPAPSVPVPSPPPAPLEEVWLDLPDGNRAQAWSLVDPALPAAARQDFFVGRQQPIQMRLPGKRAGPATVLHTQQVGSHRIVPAPPPRQATA